MFNHTFIMYICYIIYKVIPTHTSTFTDIISYILENHIIFIINIKYIILYHVD